MKFGSPLLVAIAATLANGLPAATSTSTSSCADAPALPDITVAPAVGKNITSSDFTGGLVPISGFKASCSNIHSDNKDAAVIWACCKSGKGWGLHNKFHLGKCMQNLDGKLTSYHNGDFWRTCDNCALKDGQNPTVYHCTCRTDIKNGPEQFLETTIDLNDFIGNTGGVLACHGVPETHIEGSCSSEDFPSLE
ncbi:Cyanovirin-N [Colletotrichum zoysiae]|uniref:Cyanovirin-N n=1 Tax=Colletotrichum zoysiae TaxID=1216348 RepID=A0AAD9HIW3_9PEZI|nr:Cyanovirin-N [Colletotrichum zoysiae]